MFVYKMIEVRQDINIPFYEHSQEFHDYIHSTHPDSIFTEVVDQDGKRRTRTTEWTNESHHEAMVNDPMVAAAAAEKNQYNEQHGIAWFNQIIPK